MNRQARIRSAALAVLALLLLVASPVAADEALRARAAEAFEAGRALTLKEPLDGRIDAVWHTDLLLQIRPDPQLQWWADLRRKRLTQHKTYRLVEPSAPLTPLPEDPGTGMAKWYTYMRAPFGTPASTAIRYIREYLQVDNPLAPPESGYILTHQLLVLEWAEMVGVELPPEVLAKKPELLARITEEHARDDVFSDLFAERICFLVLYGDPSASELERSVRVILDAQVEPGVWAPPAITLVYDGESHHTEVEPEHARKMAMVALAAYLRDAGADAGTDADTGTGTDAGTDTDADAGTVPWLWVGVGLFVLLFIAGVLRRRA